MMSKHLGILSIVSAVTIGLAQVALADEAKFSAEVDRTQVGLDDTVSLKFSVQADGSVSTTPPGYNAPDFEEINSYESSFVESYYDSNTGRISMRNNQSLTKVLKPMKTGNLRISQIQISINGKTKKAPDIVIQVGSSGSGTPPPRNYGGGGVGLRGATKRPASNTVFVRAEVDKDKVYKGEEVVVSYYLYRRVRVLNAQVDKFPMLNGFLREEMEMPVMQPRLEVQSVVLDGVPYQRSLLARYAAFPLQEGKLKVDPMGLKYTYYAGGGMDDGEDPFLQFFKQMTPREGSSASEPIMIDVQPLPADGKPASFSGAVGDFSIVSAVDKTEVRANEAVTLTVKIEGRGNVAAIGQPKANWPQNVELYDSKGSAKTSKAGVGEKDFEILLIPRAPGDVTLPGLEFSYFDPSKKQYVTRNTDPIQIHVLEAAPGSQAPRPLNPATTGSSATGTPANTETPSPSKSLRELKAPVSAESSLGGLPLWRWMYVLAVGAVGIFAAWVGFDLFKKFRTQGRESAAARAKAKQKSWDRLASDASRAGVMSWSEILQAYDLLSGNVLDAIDRVYSIGARSLPRSEIKRILIDEKGLSASHWDPIGRLLEFNEMIRFAGSASAGLETRARSELSTWVSSAKSAVQLIEQERSSQDS
ncbi:MAG: BatD family protein [Bdellovibrionia bacterium]